MPRNTKSQMLHLLFRFQNISNEVEIDRLRREGIIGTDGRIHVFGNECEVISQLRTDGWVIETDLRRPSKYIYRGHYDSFAKDVQRNFIEIKAVHAPPHLYRTRPRPDGLP